MVQACLTCQGETRLVELPALARYRIGRDPGLCDLVVPAHWQGCSRHQAELRQDGSRWLLRDGMAGVASSNGTYLADGTAAGQGQRLPASDQLQFWIGHLPAERIEITIKGLAVGQHPPVDVRQEAVQNNNRSKAAGRPESSLSITTESGVISIGRHPNCSIQLDDPAVSRLHVLVRPEAGGTALVEDRSSNGLYIEGQRASRLSRILPGVQLQIGRSRFLWQDSRLVPVGEQVRYGIEVRDLVLPNRLRDVSLSIGGGELVALVGGSGAGKSSLLTTLAGQNTGYQGEILVSGENLRQAISALRPLMGFVPQDDIVHRELTVREVLATAARLRIPESDVRPQAVQRVMELMELSHRRDALVRDLSGGQRKRVNIGMELVSDPRLLFLDEPTSGLDPGLDRRMMKLLRQLANQGHTVLVVTHATANVHLCDRLIFLGRGGRLCFSGAPSMCLQHFGVSGDFAEVYELLDQDEAGIAAEAHRYSQSHPLPPAASPAKTGEKTTRNVAGATQQPLRQLASQVRTLLVREGRVALRDRVSLALNLLTGPVAVLLLGAAIQKASVFEVPDAGVTAELLPMAIKVVFVISCACIWSGISSHIAAVARERPIYERERAFNLMPLAYVLAKALMILILAIPQALLITATAAALFHLPSGLVIGHGIVGYGLAALLTIMASGGLALFLSTVVKDQRQASSSSPLLLMPQLIFSGVLFEIGSLTILYPFVASRWSVKLFGAYSALERLKFESTLPGFHAVDPTPYLAVASNVHESMAMLLMQFVGFSVLAYAALARRKGLKG